MKQVNAALSICYYKIISGQKCDINLDLNLRGNNRIAVTC